MKFANPLNGELWITQTYHTSHGNTAVDFSAVVDTPVRAVLDGVVGVNSPSGGSYCTLEADGFPLTIFYVHTYRWLAPNTRVKRGDVICYVAPKSLNGGYATHLHLGMDVDNNRQVMDYMDRSLLYNTKYSAVASAWFKNGVFDWSKHDDFQVTTGENMAYDVNTKLRQGDGVDYPQTGLIVAGAVGKVIDGPRQKDGYTWYDLSFGDKADPSKYATGWAIMGRFTDTPVTNLDATPIATPIPEDPAVEKVKSGNFELVTKFEGYKPISNKIN